MIEAHDYVDNDLTLDAPKVMILTRVVLGRQFTPTDDMRHLQSPPRGYDSVRTLILIYLYKLSYFMSRLLANQEPTPILSTKKRSYITMTRFDQHILSCTSLIHRTRKPILIHRTRKLTLRHRMRKPTLRHRTRKPTPIRITMIEKSKNQTLVRRWCRGRSRMSSSTQMNVIVVGGVYVSVVIDGPIPRWE